MHGALQEAGLDRVVSVMLISRFRDVVIGQIDVAEANRRQGYATAAMKILISQADAMGVDLSMEVDVGRVWGDLEEDDSTPEDTNGWLVDWYAGMGFEDTGQEGDFGPMMRRPAAPVVTPKP